MKIISRTEFLKMPKGTVFCKFPRFDEKTRSYRTYTFGIDEPCIKMDDPGEMENDYYSLGIGSDLEPAGAQGCNDMDEVYADMERNLGKEVPFDYSYGRDGMFETDDEVGYAIFGRYEVEKMINVLQESLNTAYGHRPVEGASEQLSPEIKALLSRKTEELDLSVRTRNILRANGIDTILDLCRLRKIDWLNFRNGGKKSLAELDDFMKAYNLTWGMNV